MSTFLVNKYAVWYTAICTRAIQRTVIGYVEKHHIVPRALGGTNDPSNIVKLTAREHFVCHKLLTKMTSGRDNMKMIHALWMMATSKKHQKNRKISSREYDFLKKRKSENMKTYPTRLGTKTTPEGREGLRQAQLIAQNKPEVKAKVAATKALPHNKIRYSVEAKLRSNNPETKEKIRLKHNKSILQIDMLTGEVVNSFVSGKEAERCTKISRSHISNCAHGKRNHAGNFKWIFPECNQ